VSAPAEIYEAAALAYDRAVNDLLLHNPPGLVLGVVGRRLWTEHPAFRAAVDAVWPLAVAEGRRQASEDIRAAHHRGMGDASWLYADEAARIAAGAS